MPDDIRTETLSIAQLRAKTGGTHYAITPFHDEIGFRGRSSANAWCVAANGLLPDPTGPVADGPNAERDATRAGRFDRGAAARGGGPYSPGRCRFKYRPFREMPSDLAAGSTRP